VPLDAALEFFGNEEEFFACVVVGGQPFKRSLPQREILQANPAIVELFRRVLAFGQLQDSLKENPCLNACYKFGWLQAETSEDDKVAYIFPTRLHQRYDLSTTSVLNGRSGWIGPLSLNF